MAIKLTALLAALMIISAQPGNCTTIAWDGTYLAADSAATLGGHIRAKSGAKIVYCPERKAWIGLAGDASLDKVFYAWFAEISPIQPKWDDIDVLVVYNSGQCEYYGSANPVEVHDSFAIGSGKDIALTAMALGCSAAESIKTAEHIDIFTGGPIQIVKFDDVDKSVKIHTSTKGETEAEIHALKELLIPSIAP